MRGVHDDGSIVSFSPEHEAAIKKMLSQLLIVFVKRAGGTVDIPSAEIDATSQDLLAFKIDPETRTYTFLLKKKN